MNDDMLNVSSWKGLLGGVPRREPSGTIRAVLRSYNDGSRASLVLTAAREKYWIKCLGNPQGDLILATERLVSGVGELIGAPVRPTRLLRIPADLAGVQYGPSSFFRESIAHGSLHVEAAEEAYGFLYPRRDHNAQRRAAIVALWDWCMGDDEQWLYDHGNESSLWSFDHGFWLGGDGGDWDPSLLQRLVSTPWEHPEPLPAAARSEASLIADKIEQITANQIVEVLASVPLEWGLDDHALEVAGWFLYRRRIDVAQRMRAA